MYMCYECGAIFEEPDKGYFDPSPDGVSLPQGHYEISCCPKCGGDCEEAEKCRACGEWHLEWGVLCKECEETLADGLDRLRDAMGMTQDDFEEAIDEHFEW